jgi:hypothetical protein
MSAAEFVLGVMRLAALLGLGAVTAHKLRIRWTSESGSTAVLAELVLLVSLLLVSAELLGLLSLDRFWPLVGVLAAVAIAATWLGRQRPHRGRDARPPASAKPGRGVDLLTLAAAGAVIVVVAQWLVLTADTLGAGMFNFDTLWYHMPFAAGFFHTGSVTTITFTQADPFTAYYPANSELFHTLGMIVFRNDFLSPLLNLAWLGIALLASWCIGRRWRLEPLTLLAGAMVLSLPVLSTTQPGEAFNDIFGLAMLLAAVALLADPRPGAGILVTGGLALGAAVGTKYTFIVPAAVLIIGVSLLRPRGFRLRRAGLIIGPLLVTGGWWYLRDAIDVGNPLGLRINLAGITLPGPASPLATAAQQTVFSQLRHVSLWGSRFAPGLAHALGPAWPLVILLYLAAVILGLRGNGDRLLPVLAVTAGLTGISYLFLPTGAQSLAQGPALFQVNLRYVTPALALGLVLLPGVVSARWRRGLGPLAVVLAALVLISQLEHALWPTQPGRHLAFLVIVAVAAAGLMVFPRLLRRRTSVVTGLAVLALLVLGGGAYAVQRHYFSQRYLDGLRGDPALGSIYRWAQGVSNARIALYGDVRQYPLYGARDTNRVSYLGTRTGDGGYRPISSCRAWWTALAKGHYQWLVLSPAPTTAVPLSWSTSDPALRPVLHPAPAYFVFRITGRPSPDACA